MDDTEGPIRQPELASECPAAPTLLEEYYRPLVQLAALLTGDADTAEAVVSEALALLPAAPLSPEASAEALRWLQQRVLLRSRRYRRPGAMPGSIVQARRGARSSVASGAAIPSVPAQPSAADFASLPVVRALQGLPRREREAVVLTHYLDLSEQQAARLAGVTPIMLRRFLSQAMRELDDRFPAA
jgi:DNA-directed RNA polymerase specialized sigma24 family protein